MTMEPSAATPQASSGESGIGTTMTLRSFAPPDSTVTSPLDACQQVGRTLGPVDAPAGIDALRQREQHGRPHPGLTQGDRRCRSRRESGPHSGQATVSEIHEQRGVVRKRPHRVGSPVLSRPLSIRAQLPARTCLQVHEVDSLPERVGYEDPPVRELPHLGDAAKVLGEDRRGHPQRLLLPTDLRGRHGHGPHHPAGYRVYRSRSIARALAAFPGVRQRNL
jgi:hypothetical protein